MQFIAPALHPVRAGIGDIFPLIAPPYFVAPTLHLADEILPIYAHLHSFPDVVHEPEFPALSLSGCPVFPVAHLPSTPLIGGQNRELMLHANLITDLPELPQSGRCLVQLHPGFKADGVDHEVGMYVSCIAVGGYLDLVSRPSLGCKLQTDFVSLPIGDLFFGRKGLDILVEIDPIHLVISGLGGEKFREGIGAVAVQSGHVADACFRIGGLVLPLAVAHNRFHSTDVLLGFLDIGYSCQPLPPMRISSS